MAFGLYVHIPFCPQICPYCSFAVLTEHLSLYDRYVAAVCDEIRSWQSRLAAKGPLDTVYFGGGTPTLLAPVQLQRILDTTIAALGLAADAEITLEANPSTAEATKFRDFRQLGCTRLSLGVQALHDADLQTLGRLHTAAEAEQAYAVARAAGFANVNLDLMFSIPGAPRRHWQQTLQRSMALQPDHISTYSLTIEEGTQFARRYHHGRIPPVSEEDDAWAYAWTMERLEAAGYEHYEVSNFARLGYRSRHNWGYWHGAEYLGVGMSAHSYLEGKRHWNVRNIQHYITRLETGSSPCTEAEVLPPAAARHEQIWLQLRTSAGVQLTAAELQTLQGAETFQGLLQDGRLQLEAQRLRLTPGGFLLADAIAVEVAALLEVPH